MLAYKLHEAAKRADIDEVRKLVSEGANVNEYDSEGRLPLHYLIIEYLVFNSTDDVQRTLEIVDILTEAGGDINAKEKEGQRRTILHWAAESKDPELVKGLLQRNADVHSGNYFNDTPLHLAVCNYSVRANDIDQNATVELLLERGASINAVNDIGFKPTTTSETSENPTLHNLLLRYGVPSMEKTKEEKELASLFSKFSSLFIKEEHKKQYQPKPLREIAADAAIKIRYSENVPINYYKNLLLLPGNVRESFPELEFDSKKLFVYKVNKIIERKAAVFDETNNPKELAYLREIKQALSSENPYNTIHGVMGRLGRDIKIGFMSVFKDHMEPVRGQIVQAMKEYIKDKALYERPTKGM